MPKFFKTISHLNKTPDNYFFEARTSFSKWRITVLIVTPIVCLKPRFCGHNYISLFDITTNFRSFKFPSQQQQ